MIPEEYKTYYDFIIDVIHEAGQVVIEGFNKVKAGSEQHDNSIILTETHERVEQLLKKKIKNRFPEHLIIESTTTESLTNAHTWIINPLDGITNFKNGIPMVAISVALAIEKNSVVGIIFNPIMNQFYSAVKSGGAYCNGQRIVSTKNKDLRKSIVGTELSFQTEPFLRDQAFKRVQTISQYGVLGFRSFGSVTMSLCYVASGSLDVYFTDALHCSEVAAGILILQEAGGSVNCLNGTKEPILNCLQEYYSQRGTMHCSRM